MTTRSSKRLAIGLLGLVAAGLGGCERDPAAPTGGTVALAVIPGAHHGGRPYTTEMTQEVTTTPEWAGDPDGSGTARITLNPGHGEVCWDLSVADITLPATASHIHQAAPGVRGGIVVFLSAPDATGRATGCTSGVDRGLVRAILRNPGAFYVNVHTSDFPPGAIRGQLPE